MIGRILGLGLAVCALAWASDMTATTSNGSVVILHDNGRWEYYNNNSRVRDIRESAIPKDMQTTVSIEYESADKLRKDMRMRMEADFATEENIKDSLRTLPAGGIVHFCVPEAQVHYGNPRTFTYTVAEFFSGCVDAECGKNMPAVQIAGWARSKSGEWIFGIHRVIS